ncbi:MAG: 50S ribosomal protein L9 [Gammaproteobacteria bacterium]|nr:50S ribosomal protein L9 [Gammaproteobacteria bacterium]
MNVLLLDRVTNLGDLGDEVRVKPGFARNYLIPRGLALKATDENRKVFAEREQELKAMAVERLEGAEKRAALLDDLEITILARAVDASRLYGSVGPVEIAREISDLGIEVNKSEVKLTTGAIRELGEFEVEIRVHADVSRIVRVIVDAE